MSAYDETLSLIDIGRIVYRDWLLVVSITIVAVILSVASAYIITPIYRATVVIMPVEGSEAGDRLGQMVGSLSGLASLAGVAIPSSAGGGEALATLTSRAFVRDFITALDLMPVLFSDVWDSNVGTWISEDPGEAPTINDAAGFFSKEVLTVDDDPINGLVTLSIEWTDREAAATWANEMVRRLNARIRELRIRDAKRSLVFLKAELEQTQTAVLKDTINQLIREQIQVVMLANVTEDYAFRVIDPAFISDEDGFVWPRRSIIVILGIIGGFFLGVLVALFKFSTNPRLGS